MVSVCYRYSYCMNREPNLTVFAYYIRQMALRSAFVAAIGHSMSLHTTYAAFVSFVFFFLRLNSIMLSNRSIHLVRLLMEMFGSVLRHGQYFQMAERKECKCYVVGWRRFFTAENERVLIIHFPFKWAFNATLDFMVNSTHTFQRSHYL